MRSLNRRGEVDNNDNDQQRRGVERRREKRRRGEKKREVRREKERRGSKRRVKDRKGDERKGKERKVEIIACPQPSVGHTSQNTSPLTKLVKLLHDTTPHQTTIQYTTRHGTAMKAKTCMLCCAVCIKQNLQIFVEETFQQRVGVSRKVRGTHDLLG